MSEKETKIEFISEAAKLLDEVNHIDNDFCIQDNSPKIEGFDIKESVHDKAEELIALLIPERVLISTLIPDGANSRKHNNINLDAIKGSLRKFGQQTPIVICKDNIVRKGNGVFTAAKELGWKYINAIKTQLTGSELIAYGITDNRTSDLSEFDNAVLPELIGGLMEEDFKLDELGWTHEDISKVLQAEDDNLNFENELKIEDSNKIPEEHNARKTRSIKVTPAQRVIIDGAIAKVRENMGDADITEGRCIEVICADFLQSIEVEHGGSYGE